MRKIVSILLVIVISNILFPYEKTVMLNNGNKKVIEVPETKEELEKAFVKSITAHLNTKINLNDALDTIQENSKRLKSSNNIIDDLSNRNATLFEVLKTRKKTSWFRPFVLAGMNYSLDKSVNGNLGVGFTVLDWVDISVIGYFPNFAIGGQIKVYISK